MAQDSRRRSLQVVVSLLFFLSGMSGLVYEIVWSRKLQLMFGVSTFAITTVVAAYMAGLAIGSGLCGRLADRLSPRRALAGYGILELTLGLFALLFPLLLGAVSAIYGALAPSTVGLRIALQFTLAFGLLLVPTVLMGGTLPLISRFFVAASGRTTQGFGWAYALNTLGAVAGVLLAGFVLLETLGVRGSLTLFGGLNVVIGATALAVARRGSDVPVAEAAPAAEVATEAEPGRSRVRLLAAAGISGCVALGCEIAWVRGFATLMVSTTYTFSLVLATYLVGIALGSAIASRLRPTRRIATIVFTLLGACALAQILLFDFCHARMFEASAAENADFGSLLGTQAYLIALVVLPLTLCSGAAMPLIVGLSSRGLDSTGRDVGAVYIANTIGAVTGVVAAGFLLLPAFGPFTTCRVLAVASLAGLLLVGGLRKTALVGVAGVAALVLLPSPSPKVQAISPVLIGSRVKDELPGTWEESVVSEILSKAHGLTADIAVTASADNGHRSLWINGMPNASTYGDLVTQISLAAVPYVYAPRVRDCVHVGLGSGVTPGAWAALPGTENVTIVELEGELWEAARHFAPYHFGLHDRRGVKFVADDGRSHLVLAPEQSYDIVISEPSQIWSKGVGNLFTSEFFRTAKRALRPDGLFATWIMSYSVPDHVWAIAVATLLDEFEHVVCFADPYHPGDAFFLCSKSPVRFRPERWKALQSLRGRDAFIPIALELDEPDALAIYYVAHKEQLAEKVLPVLRAAGVEHVRNTDDHPILEHLYPKSLHVGGHVEVMDQLLAGRFLPGADGGGTFRTPPGIDGAKLRDRIVWLLCRQTKRNPLPLLAGVRDLAELERKTLDASERGWAYAAAVVADSPLAARLEPQLTREDFREWHVIMAAGNRAMRENRAVDRSVLRKLPVPNRRTPTNATVTALQGWFAQYRATGDTAAAASYVETFLKGFPEDRIVISNPPILAFQLLARAAVASNKTEVVETYLSRLGNIYGWHYIPASLGLMNLLVETGRHEDAKKILARFDGWTYAQNKELQRLREGLR